MPNGLDSLLNSKQNTRRIMVFQYRQINNSQKHECLEIVS